MQKELDYTRTMRSRGERETSSREKKAKREYLSDTKQEEVQGSRTKKQFLPLAAGKLDLSIKT